jgi:hypothetical protein
VLKNARACCSHLTMAFASFHIVWMKMLKS